MATTADTAAAAVRQATEVAGAQQTASAGFFDEVEALCGSASQFLAELAKQASAA